MGAVGRADLDEPGAGARHDLRHAEDAADLDEFAARHDGLAAVGQRIEAQEHGGGIVVDDRRVLGARQRAQQAPDVVVTLPAFAGFQVELERDRIPHGGDGRFDCGLGERRSPEIGVQHRAAQVEQRSQRRPVLLLETGESLSGDMLAWNAGALPLAMSRAHRSARRGWRPWTRRDRSAR